ncbi:transcription repressor OFP6-like [Vigna radiata var. radiata]|uniref:Transcription repressor n=1 Tax=Vigna radiata var. radiata TaxID=3916 RepID=A0A1S3TIP3_VIGRR|nr:transcription repressor OFP6-like [Vigna radiata var. radiata]
MSSTKKSLLRTVFTANGSCGCSKSNSSEVHEPTPKPKTSNNTHQKPNNLSSMASSTTSMEQVDEEEFTSTTVSESETFHDPNNNNNNVALKRSPLVDSVAIEKDSSNPYHDFRHSMLQMIFEKEIESEDDLQDLLQCFLHLNAPCHHHIIVKAFNAICEEAFSRKVGTTPAASEPSPSRRSPLRKSK